MRSIAFTVIFTVLIGCASNASALTFNHPLVDAADQGRTMMVEKMLHGGYYVNAEGDFSTTALMRAAYRGHVGMAKMLLNYGADPNLRDIGGETSLHLAVRSGDIELISSLIEHGGDINAQDQAGNTPVALAFINERKPLFRYLLAQTKNARIENEEQESLLALAARQGDLTALNLLLKHPSLLDISQEEINHITLIAKAEGHQAFVQQLQQHPKLRKPNKEEIKTKTHNPAPQPSVPSNQPLPLIPTLKDASMENNAERPSWHISVKDPAPEEPLLDESPKPWETTANRRASMKEPAKKGVNNRPSINQPKEPVLEENKRSAINLLKPRSRTEINNRPSINRVKPPSTHIVEEPSINSPSTALVEPEKKTIVAEKKQLPPPPRNYIAKKQPWHDPQPWKKAETIQPKSQTKENAPDIVEKPKSLPVTDTAAMESPSSDLSVPPVTRQAPVVDVATHKSPDIAKDNSTNTKKFSDVRNEVLSQLMAEETNGNKHVTAWKKPRALAKAQKPMHIPEPPASVVKKSEQPSAEKKVKKSPAPVPEKAERKPEPRKERAMLLPAKEAQKAPVFRMQIGTYQSEDQALYAWDNLKNRYPNIFAPLRSQVKMVHLHGSQKIFRLRSQGFSDRSKTMAHCRELNQHNVPCFVVEGMAEKNKALVEEKKVPSVKKKEHVAEKKELKNDDPNIKVFAGNRLPWLKHSPSVLTQLLAPKPRKKNKPAEPAVKKESIIPPTPKAKPSYPFQSQSAVLNEKKKTLKSKPVFVDPEPIKKDKADIGTKLGDNALPWLPTVNMTTDQKKKTTVMPVPKPEQLTHAAIVASKVMPVPRLSPHMQSQASIAKPVGEPATVSTKPSSDSYIHVADHHMPWRTENDQKIAQPLPTKKIEPATPVVRSEPQHNYDDFYQEAEKKLQKSSPIRRNVSEAVRVSEKEYIDAFNQRRAVASNTVNNTPQQNSLELRGFSTLSEAQDYWQRMFQYNGDLSHLSMQLQEEHYTGMVTIKTWPVAASQRGMVCNMVKKSGYNCIDPLSGQNIHAGSIKPVNQNTYNKPAALPQYWIMLGTFQNANEASQYRNQVELQHKDIVQSQPFYLTKAPIHGGFSTEAVQLNIGPLGSMVQAQQLCSGLKRRYVNCFPMQQAR